MELKTTVHAETGKQELTITRDFDLPVELLFKAHSEPEFIGQWMGTNVVKFEDKKHGSYQYETSDKNGNVVLKMNGVFHEFITDQKITRTFEMENTPFGIQLEFFDFDRLTDDTSRLRMHIIFRSAELRDQMLKLPFSQGINMAHNRLQEILGKLK
jgi:uncharacterized protein YndB with AHSA1/START domain